MSRLHLPNSHVLELRAFHGVSQWSAVAGIHRRFLRATRHRERLACKCLAACGIVACIHSHSDSSSQFSRGGRPEGHGYQAPTTGGARHAQWSLLVELDHRSHGSYGEVSDTAPTHWAPLNDQDTSSSTMGYSGFTHSQDSILLND